MIGSLLAMALAQSACAPLPGVAELLQGEQRFFVIGESHGTTETPAAFAAFVCEAAIAGPVTVALEMPQTMQSNLDALLTADSEAGAHAALEGTRFFDPSWKDGRTSRAMLELMLSLRRLKAAGRDIAILAFQPDSPALAGLPHAYYELEMGYLLSRAASERPGSKVLVLVGNLHARRTANPNFPALGLPAVAHLPGDQIVTLEVAPQGGGMWSCVPECSAHTFVSEYNPDARGVFMNTGGDGAYDGTLAVGPSTASWPVSAAEE